MENLRSGTYWLEGIGDSYTIYIAYEEGNICYATDQNNMPDRPPYSYSVIMINDTTVCLMVQSDVNQWMYWDSKAKEGIVTFDTNDGTPTQSGFQFVLTDNGDGTYEINPQADSTLFLTVQQNTDHGNPYSVKCLSKGKGKTQKWKFVQPVVPA